MAHVTPLYTANCHRTLQLCRCVYQVRVSHSHVAISSAMLCLCFRRPLRPLAILCSFKANPQCVSSGSFIWDSKPLRDVTALQTSPEEEQSWPFVVFFFFFSLPSLNL